jgi:hypothetical protein
LGLIAATLVLAAWTWPNNVRSAVILAFSALPAVWALREARALVLAAGRPADAWFADAVATVLLASAIALVLSASAAAWSLQRRVPLRHIARTIASMVIGHVPDADLGWRQ